MEGENITITGVIKRVVFRNNENGFSILNIFSDGRSLTASGTFFDTPIPQSKITLTGKFSHHKKYGLQFAFETYEIFTPGSRTSVIEYLSSSVFKGIGKSLASEIYDSFKEDTIDIIDNFPERLKDVKGIGNAKFESIVKGLNESRGFRKAIMFFKPYQFSDYQVKVIYERFKDASVAVAKNNPYLFTEIRGIGFKKADIMAQKLGIKKDDAHRVKEALIYSVRVLCENTGNSFVYLRDIKVIFDDIIEGSGDFGNMEINGGPAALGSGTDITGEMDLKPFLNELKNEKRLIFEIENGSNLERIYLPAYYYAETGAAREINRIVSVKMDDKLNKIMTRYKEKKEDFLVELTAEQKYAVLNALSHKISIISGGPGTGKSTVIKEIVELYSGRKVALCSLSGKATQRLSDILGNNISPGVSISTIHRLLGARFSGKGNDGELREDSAYFSYDENNRLPFDLIIIDEMSMVDIMIFYRLLKAVKDETVLVLVGDVNQIPSVNPGDVLRDIIYSDSMDPYKLKPVFPLTFLTRVFRQAEGGLININAQNILKNEKFILCKKDENSCEFRIFYKKDYDYKESGKKALLDDLEGFIKKVAEKRKKANNGIINPAMMKDVQVLTPMKRGELGYYNLNNILQDIMNPGPAALEDCFKCNGIEFRSGDRVIQRRNNYDTDVFNGDSGIIIEINHSEKKVIIDFSAGTDGSKIVEYGFIDTYDNIALSYALSIHKSQGSEFDNVIILFHQSHYMMLKKNLLYTAVTRGKKNVVIFGTYKAFGMALNSREDLRNSGFKDRLYATK